MPTASPLHTRPSDFRPDLLATHQQLQRLELGAVFGAGEAMEPALLAEGEAFGRDLFGRVFAGELGAHWRTLRAHAQAADEAVRLRLRVDASAPALEALPWEFLHDGQSFLAPDRQVLLSRGIADLPDLPLPLEESGPLAVLVIVAAPLNLAEEQSFEPDQEAAVISDALAEPRRRGQIQIDVVEEASASAIQRALIARDYGVVHFIGHGDVDERRGGYLVAEEDNGDARRLFGDEFANLLAGRGVRLVLLSSCLTARVRQRAPTPAWPPPCCARACRRSSPCNTPSASLRRGRSTARCTRPWLPTAPWMWP